MLMKAKSMITRTETSILYISTEKHKNHGKKEAKKMQAGKNKKQSGKKEKMQRTNKKAPGKKEKEKMKKKKQAAGKNKQTKTQQHS